MCSSGPRDALDFLEAAFVHDEMEVDAAIGPEGDPAEVGDRGENGDSDLASPAKSSEHACCRRIGRDDDIGTV